MTDNANPGAGKPDDSKPQQPKPAVAIGRPIRGDYPGSVLDTSPDHQPFITSDAKTSAGELELIGGYMYEDPKTGEPKRLHLAIMREMSGHEEDIMASSKMEMGRRLNSILSNCLERIGDGQGTYLTSRGDLVRAVDKLTIADRTQMLLFLRIISTSEGRRFTFKANCPQCGAEFQKTIDLGELKKYPMPDPEERLYDVRLDDGKMVRCRIMLGENEALTDKAQQSGQNILSASLLARVIDIDGKPAGLSEVKGLRMRDRNKLRSEFERREGGVQTSAPHMCGGCGAQFEADIDITQKGFFFPSETQRN